MTIVTLKDLVMQLDAALYFERQWGQEADVYREMGHEELEADCRGHAEEKKLESDHLLKRILED